MKIKGRLKKDFLKALSVVLAVLLWGYVLNSERISFEKNYSLNYILPEGLVFSQRPLQEISIQFNGPKAFIRNFLLQQDELLVDLNKFNYRRDSVFSIDLATIHIDLPFGMIIEKIVPRKINIRLDRKVTKKVPIKLSNHLGDSSSIIKFSPEELDISGPKFLINELKAIYVRPLDLDLLEKQKVLPIEITLPDERLNLETTEKVSAFLSNDDKLFKMELKSHPIKFLTSTKKFKTSTKQVTAKITLKDITKSRSIISSSLQVWADIPENARGRVEVPLRIIKEADIENVEIIPKSIIVNIE